MLRHHSGARVGTPLSGVGEATVHVCSMAGLLLHVLAKVSCSIPITIGHSTPVTFQVSFILSYAVGVGLVTVSSDGRYQLKFPCTNDLMNPKA